MGTFYYCIYLKVYWNRVAPTSIRYEKVDCILNKHSRWLLQALLSTIPCSFTTTGHIFSRFVDSPTSATRRWPIELESPYARYKPGNICSKFMRVSCRRSQRPSKTCSKPTMNLAPHRQTVTQRLRQLYCLLLSVRVPSSYFCVDFLDLTSQCFESK